MVEDFHEEDTPHVPWPGVSTRKFSWSISRKASDLTHEIIAFFQTRGATLDDEFVSSDSQFPGYALRFSRRSAIGNLLTIVGLETQPQKIIVRLQEHDGPTEIILIFAIVVPSGIKPEATRLARRLASCTA